MKITLLFLLFIFLMEITGNAQDTVFLKNAEKIFCKVTEVGSEQVKYKKVDFPDGPEYLIPKVSIAKIVYRNGSSDIFVRESKGDSVAENAALKNQNVKLAQDSVFRKNNCSDVGKIIGTDLIHIRMRKGENPKTPPVLISRSSILKIRHADGTVEIFNALARQPMVSDSMFRKGVMDATKNYVHPGGRGFVIITTILTGGIGGIIPAVICSSAKPKLANLNCPDQKLMQNENYMRGYTHKAKKMKQKRIWGGYGLGILGAITLGFVLKNTVGQ